MNQKIIYIGNFMVPEGDATAQLVNTNAKLFKTLGYDVLLVGNSRSFDRKIPQSPNRFVHNGMQYIRLDFRYRLSDFHVFFSQYRILLNILKENLDSIDYVIFYRSPTFSIFAGLLLRWCKRRKIKVIFNMADIPNVNHGSMLQRILKKWDKQLLEYLADRHADGIIAVSHFIANYFNQKAHKPTLILPPLVDALMFEHPSYQIDNEKIKLVYAGIPFPIDGRSVPREAYKDRLDLIIDYLLDIEKEINFDLDIYGLEKEQYLQVVCRHQQKLLNCSYIHFHGRKKSSFVQKKIAEADFTINLRSKNQMTEAGFSTKFVESISCGTPVITTNTSDLSSYLIEGVHGFWIDIQDSERACAQLKKILSVSKADIRNMKDACAQSMLFDYHNYLVKTEDFLSQL